jgi:hypothetical protein
MDTNFFAEPKNCVISHIWKERGWPMTPCEERIDAQLVVVFDGHAAKQFAGVQGEEAQTLVAMQI